MKIEKITKETASAASHIYAKSWKYAYRGIIPDSYLDSLSLERWTPMLEAASFDGYILEDKGEYIATSSISKGRDEKMDGYGEIISIYCIPQYFGYGYGESLFLFVRNELIKQGFHKIYLWVLEDNKRAQSFYEKHGFYKNGDSIEVEIGGKKLTEVRYIYISNSQKTV